MNIRKFRFRLNKTLIPDWLGTDEIILPVLNASPLKPGEIPPENILLTGTDSPGSETVILAAKVNGIAEFFFDLPGTINLLKNENYPGSKINKSIVEYLPFDYTALPMKLVGLASKILSGKTELNKLPDFPAYPGDNSADLVYTFHKNDPGAVILKWPENKKYCVVFTHDVDTAWIFDNREGIKWLKNFRETEESCRITSAWYCVPAAMKSENSRAEMQSLNNSGHEIGAHGFKHDPGLPFESKDKLIKKLNAARDKIHEILNDTVSLGYRAPWLSRSSVMYEALSEAGFVYDTSPPNADFNRRSLTANNGCCTFFPFLRNNILVLPVTVPQDAFIKTLGLTPAKYWEWIYFLSGKIKKAGGLINISTHIQPHHSGNGEMLKGYKWLIKQFSGDNNAWITTALTASNYAKSSLVNL